jgi:flagellar L-ring protein precursor FlgH
MKIKAVRDALLLAATVPCVLLGPVARGESLWDRRDYRAAFLFVDSRARRVGDVLTVVVREATDIDNKEKRALNKSNDTRGSFLTKGNSSGTVFSSRSLAADFNAEVDSSRKFDGNAEFSSQRELVDRMTVTVMDVLPNGNLVIEGTRRRLISGDERVLRVSGVVRPIDIGAGNIVESQFIANFQVAYEGKGVESKFVNQGWMSRFVNHVWPF